MRTWLNSPQIKDTIGVFHLLIMVKKPGMHHGYGLCTLQRETLSLPGERFIGVEILRKSVLTAIQYPLDTG